MKLSKAARYAQIQAAIETLMDHLNPAMPQEARIRAWRIGERAVANLADLRKEESANRPPDL